MKVVCTIEARMTSSRLPGKVLMPAGGKPLLQILIERLKRAKNLDAIVIATTTNATDNPIESLGRELGIPVFRGSEDDVLGRVCGALRMMQADVCVEITGDCPLMDPRLVDEMIMEYKKTADDHRYISNIEPHRAVPDGLDIQVFATSALYQLEQETRDPLDREHVSYGFYRSESGLRWKPRWVVHESTRGAQDLMLTLDYTEDYELIRRCHEELSQQDAEYSARDLIVWMREHPELQKRCQDARKTKANV